MCEPRHSPHFIYWEMAEGARFENPSASENIVRNQLSSIHLNCLQKSQRQVKN